MSEQEDAVTDLSGAGVLAGIHWAGTSAYWKTMDDYDPKTGHKPGWVGYTAHSLLCDRLDRVFSCGDFHLPVGLPAGAGMDIVKEGLPAEDADSMPYIEPGLVSYSPLNGSPGWKFGSWRWLLQSFQFGESRKIPWARMSATKRRVASYQNPDQPDIFGNTGLPPEGFGSEPAITHSENEEEDTITTLVLAHSIHRELRRREFLLGRPNRARGQAWHWNYNLMRNPPDFPGGRQVGGSPQPYTPNPNDVVSDAPLRLRQEPQKSKNEETSD
ncbi:hypothetical protein ACH4TE_24075 [Streptomyces sioyaensis]|uniref:hypothetical protein n=1 Tax=Streptomyces sioyaensis TaxID=67364 RepID=UPI0037B25586